MRKYEDMPPINYLCLKEVGKQEILYFFFLSYFSSKKTESKKTEKKIGERNGFQLDTNFALKAFYWKKKNKRKRNEEFENYVKKFKFFFSFSLFSFTLTLVCSLISYVHIIFAIFWIERFRFFFSFLPKKNKIKS